MSTFLSLLFDGDGDEHLLPPGLPPMRACIRNELMSANCATERFEGPWFTTQLVISATIGITSFLLFSYCRTRWPLSFAPRTKLKGAWNSARLWETFLIPSLGFSPHEAHAHQAFFGWIMPTIRTSEFTVLQIVGLDAAVVSYATVNTSYLIVRFPASQLLQNGVLSLFCVLSFCSDDSYASQLDGVSLDIYDELF